MEDRRERLFSDFSPVATQDWMDKIQVDLKGADFEKKLVWRTNEGFNVGPFYRKEDLDALKTTAALPGDFPYMRGNKKKDNIWMVRQDVSVYNPASANAWALDVLNRGADALGFDIRTAQPDESFLNALLDNIYCNSIELNFKIPFAGVLDFSRHLVGYFTSKGYGADDIKGSINFDPVGDMLRTGQDLSEYIGVAKELIEIYAPFPHFRCLGVNSVLLNNSGAYIYQELGYALAWGNEYLSQLTESGLPAAAVARRLKFNFGVGPDYFMEMAKFRAARFLWANIVAAYLDDTALRADASLQSACQMQAHAETSVFNMTIYDSYVNMLRSQTEAMSAVLAGVDSLTVLPFDVAFAEHNAFSERIARNQQLLLKEEAHFDKVVDPAGGSYYIEHLTSAIAEQAWKLFLEVEDAGGMMQGVCTNAIQDDINHTNKARHEAVSKRKEILLGTNQFPNFNEISSLSLSFGTRLAVEGFCKTLNASRSATQFEQLRIETEKSGQRPKAFMLTIGNLAMRQARAQFSCNFLACAGYEVIDNLGFNSIEEGVNAAMNANADIIVLCSSDDEYAQYAIPAYQYVNGRAMFIVAGAPACMDELKAAGIEHFIHVRCNVLNTLSEYNHLLGIS